MNQKVVDTCTTEFDLFQSGLKFESYKKKI